MDDNLILEKIDSIGLYRTIKEIKIENNFFIRNSDKVKFEQFWNFIEFGDYDIDETFLEDCIAHELIQTDKLFDLPMLIYSKLSKEFIDKYTDYLNWNRMLLYIISSNDVNIFDYEDIILKYDLWNLVSTIELPYEFMVKYSDNLVWKFLYMTREEWSEEEIEVFPDLLIYLARKERLDEINKIDQISF